MNERAAVTVLLEAATVGIVAKKLPSLRNLRTLFSIVPIKKEKRKKRSKKRKEERERRPELRLTLLEENGDDEKRSESP